MNEKEKEKYVKQFVPHRQETIPSDHCTLTLQEPDRAQRP